MAYITAEEANRLLEDSKEQYKAESYQHYRDWVSLNEAKINKEIETACADRKSCIIFNCPTPIFQFVRPFFSNLGYKVITTTEDTENKTQFIVTWDNEKEN